MDIPIIEVTMWNKDKLGPVAGSDNGNIYTCGKVEYEQYHKPVVDWPYLKELEPDVVQGEAEGDDATILVVIGDDGYVWKVRAYAPAKVRLVCILDEELPGQVYMLTDGNPTRYGSIEEARESYERRKRNRRKARRPG